MNPGKAFAFALLFLVSMPFGAKGADPVWEWVKVAGGALPDKGAGVIVTPTGQIYFSGVARSGSVGSTQITQGSHFWARVGADGQFVSVRTGSSPSYPDVFHGPMLALLPNGYLATYGIFGQSLSFPSVTSEAAWNSFVAVLKDDLTLQWGSTLGKNAYWAVVPAVSRSGEIGLSAGFTYARFGNTELGAISNNGSTYHDMLVAKIGSAGTLHWMRKGGNISHDTGTAVAFDSDENILSAGWSQSDNFVFGPLSQTRPAGVNTTALVVKTNPDGDAIWIRNYGTASHNRITAIQCFRNNDFIIGGYGSAAPLSEYHMYLEQEPWTSVFARCDSGGAVRWAKSVPGLRIQFIKLDENEEIYVSGLILGSVTIDGRRFTSRGVSDVFIGKFRSDGVLSWGKTAGGTFAETVAQLDVDRNGSVYVAGSFEEGATFDNFFVQGRGASDAFIAKLSDPTAILRAQIQQQPSGRSSYVGGTAEFAVQASSTVPVTYQWFRDGVAINGQTAATLSISSVRPEDGGSYYVEVTNQYGTVRSEAVRLVVAGEAPVSVTTIAGSATGVAGFVDSGVGSVARFNAPDSLAVQGDGVIVVPDAGNNAVRLLEAGGAVGTLAGKGPGAAGLENGPASAALFNVPIGVAVAPSWDIFVADGFNHVVRRISAFGVRSVSTWAGTGVEGFANGPGGQAQFQFPNDLVTDEAGNVFVTEFRGHRVRKISTDGVVTTYAGTGVAGYLDGAAGQAQFNGLAGIARDLAGNLYVTEWENDTIRKITPGGVVSTVAGRWGVRGFVDGPALTEAKLSSPNGIAVDRGGNIFFTEYGNSSVRRIDALGDVLTLVGTAGPGFADGGRTAAKMLAPGGLAAHPDGSLIVADTGNHAIRKVVWQANPAPTEAVVLIGLNPSITIFGEVGRTYRIEVTEDLGVTTPRWVVLGEVTLASPVEMWFDSLPATRGERYYRAVAR